MSNEVLPRDNAKIYCEEDGAHLVFIETTEENSFILNFVTGEFDISITVFVLT